jgi:hypothetical protein
MFWRLRVGALSGCAMSPAFYLAATWNLAWATTAISVLALVATSMIFVQGLLWP